MHFFFKQSPCLSIAVAQGIVELEPRQMECTTVDKNQLKLITTLHTKRNVNAFLYQILGDTQHFLFAESYAYVWEVENFYLIPNKLVDLEKLADQQYQLNLDDEICKWREQGTLVSVSCNLWRE